MSFHEHRMVIEAFIESQFNYFLLIWIFRSRRLDTTRIQKDTKKIQQGYEKIQKHSLVRCMKAAFCSQIFKNY